MAAAAPAAGTLDPPFLAEILRRLADVAPPGPPVITATDARTQLGQIRAAVTGVIRAIEARLVARAAANAAAAAAAAAPAAGAAAASAARLAREAANRLIAAADAAANAYRISIDGAGSNANKQAVEYATVRQAYNTAKDAVEALPDLDKAVARNSLNPVKAKINAALVDSTRVPPPQIGANPGNTLAGGGRGGRGKPRGEVKKLKAQAAAAAAAAAATVAAIAAEAEQAAEESAQRVKKIIAKMAEPLEKSWGDLAMESSKGGRRRTQKHRSRRHRRRTYARRH
jgi:hypothetical protein